MLAMLHWVKSTLEKRPLLLAASKRRSADKVLLLSCTPSCRSHLCEPKGAQVMLMSQHDAKRWLLRKEPLFTCKLNKDDFIQLQNAAFSEVGRGRCRTAQSNPTLCFIDYKRHSSPCNTGMFSSKSQRLIKSLLSPSSCLYSNQHTWLKRWKDKNCTDLRSCLKASGRALCHKVPIFLSKWQLI